jgi:hypothetical protein
MARRMVDQTMAEQGVVEPVFAPFETAPTLVLAP